MSRRRGRGVTAVLAVTVVCALLPPAAAAQPDSVVVDGERYPFGPAPIIELVERGAAHARKALEVYERLAAAAEARGATGEAFLANGATALVAIRLGMPQKAIIAGTKAIERAPALPAPALATQLVLSCYGVVGRAYRTAGDLPRARAFYERGLTVARTLDEERRNLNVGLLGAGLAEVALAQRDTRAAVAAAREAVEAAERGNARGGSERSRANFRRIAARSLTAAGQAHTSAGLYDDAEGALARARQYARLTGLGEIDTDVLGAQAALRQERADHAGAVTVFQEALAAARRINRVASIIPLSHGMARSYAALDRPEDALGAAKAAIRLVEDARGELTDTSLRTGYLDEKQGLYQLAARLALRLQRPDEAFGYAESSRARAFLDLLGNQATLSKGKTRALVDEELRMRARLAQVRALASVEGTAADPGAQAAQEAAERDYRAFIDRVRKESLEQASMMSVEPVALAEIQALLPADTTLVEYMVGADDVLAWVVERDRVRAFTLAGDRAGLVAEVRAFRDAIASQAPIDQVRDRAGALYQRLVAALRPEIRGRRLLVVPHDVLHYLPFSALRSPQGRWLVEDFALATLPSASVLKFLTSKGAGGSDQTLAIGNPDVGAGLNLRWAEREARLVGQRLSRTTVLIRGDATETQSKQLMAGAGIVHFATHGELNESDPLASALLRAFYDRLIADGPVSALRHAQLATMIAHPHPFAWAAFGLTGAAR